MEKLFFFFKMEKFKLEKFKLTNKAIFFKLK